jgi:SAM-dependent methyltransferase
MLGRLAGWAIERWSAARGLRAAPGPDASLFAMRPGEKILLHVGCGHARKEHIQTPAFRAPEWREVRIDIDASVAPDIVASVIDLAGVLDDAADALFSSHNIEHLFPHEVPLALAEFARVLKDDGVAVITCPDLRAACKWVAEGREEEVAYVSPAGPITPMDLIYSYRGFTAGGNPFMAHRWGFTLQALVEHLRAAGFRSVFAIERSGAFDLWALAVKSPRSEAELRELAVRFFPVS